MSTIIQNIERSQLREGLPSFSPGDRVRVHFQVVEGTRRRTQVFEGVVLKRQGSGLRETFTVRKQSFGVGVERTFPLHSPKIEQLEIAARGDVRRAKLYYLRDRIGKAARVAERRWGMDDDLAASPAAASAATAEADPRSEVAETEVTETEVTETEVTETEVAESEVAESEVAESESASKAEAAPTEQAVESAPEPESAADESAAAAEAPDEEADQSSTSDDAADTGNGEADERPG